MDCIIGVSVTVAVRIRRLVLCPVSTQFEPLLLLLLAAATRVFAVHSKPVPDEQSHTCVRTNMRAYIYTCVRAHGERKWMGDESRRRYNTDSTARPERLLNLSNEDSLHLSSGHGDGRADKVQPSPVGRAPSLPGKIPFTCLFARLRRFATSTTSDCAYRVNNAQHAYVEHTIGNLCVRTH